MKVKVLDAHYDNAVIIGFSGWIRSSTGGRSRKLVQIVFVHRNHQGTRWLPRSLVVRLDEVEKPLGIRIT